MLSCNVVPYRYHLHALGKCILWSCSKGRTFNVFNLNMYRTCGRKGALTEHHAMKVYWGVKA
jgi:hypothetical protein